MVDCNYCEERKADYYVEYKLYQGAIHHDNLCMECIEGLVNNEVIKELYMRKIK